MSDDKTEEPTEKKLDDAKKKGESPKSQDLSAAAGMLVITLCLSATAESASQHLSKLIRLAFDAGILARSDSEVAALAFDMALEGLWIVLPFLAAAIMAGLVSGFAQVGVIITFEPLTPKFDKLNPAEGMKKLASMKSLIELAKTLLKAIFMGAVVYQIALGLIPLLVGASSQTPAAIGHIAWSALLQLCGAAVIVFLVIGPADFALQKWQYVRDHRMNKDEIKREYKESEGDPHVKGQRKQLAHELAHSAPKARVANATVVVTNPTHFAVALLYTPGETPLPVIVAQGADAEAALIRSIAQANGVPIVGNPPLARALYKLPLDTPVPESLFEAVATVLRWVGSVEQLRTTAAPGAPAAP